MKSWLRAMDGPTIVCLLLVALASAASLSAQDDTQAQPDPKGVEEGLKAAQTPVNACELPQPESVTLAKMTPVYFQLETELGSKISTSGETFPITMTEAVMHEGHEVIAAGTTGMGEVIHAKKAGGSGAAGELILTASYLDLGEQQIPLRSMKLGLSGKDQTGLALASSVVPGLGFLVKGKNITVPAGSLAGAKLAQDTEIVITDGNEAADHCEGRNVE